MNTNSMSAQHTPAPVVEVIGAGRKWSIFIDGKLFGKAGQFKTKQSARAIASDRKRAAIAKATGGAS